MAKQTLGTSRFSRDARGNCCEDGLIRNEEGVEVVWKLGGVGLGDWVDGGLGDGDDRSCGELGDVGDDVIDGDEGLGDGIDGEARLGDGIDGDANWRYN